MPLRGFGAGHIARHLRLERGVDVRRRERGFHNRVQDAEALDRRRADIRQERERDLVLATERRENLGRIVADGRQPQTFVTKSCRLTLQLDELRSAPRSPISRTDEDEHGPVGAHDRLERPNAPALVLKAEIGDTLADLGPEPRKIEQFLRLDRRLREQNGQEGDEQPWGQGLDSHLGLHILEPALRVFGPTADRQSATGWSILSDSGLEIKRRALSQAAKLRVSLSP